jgi:uridine kinase
MTAPSFVIGLAGGTGAGKTTVSREIAGLVGERVTRVPLDNYYEDLSHMDIAEREEVNYDHPSAFEWPLLVEHLDRLRAGEAVEMPEYDFSIHNRKPETTTVEPTAVLIVEGILALYEDAVLDRLDLKVYVETDADVRILRRIRRDVIERGRELDGVIEQYLSTVKPMHERHVVPTKSEADVIIPEGANSRAVRLLADRVRAELDERDAGDADADAGIAAEHPGVGE